MATKVAAKKPRAAKATAPVETITAYKGFNSGLQCAPNGKPFQYEVGKTYTMDGDIGVCSRGFHACIDPLDVWSYYEVIGHDGKPSRFAEVELSGATSKQSVGDSKIAAASITIRAELSLPEFIKRAVARLVEMTKGKDGVTAASGDSSQLAASGDYSQLAASGHSSKLAASGDYSQLAASGHSSKLAASGHSSQLAASGHSSKLAASGHSSKLACGKNGVLVSAAPGVWAKGGEGTRISLADFNGRGECIGFATGRVGQDGIKPDTWYRAENGKLVEVA